MSVNPDPSNVRVNTLKLLVAVAGVDATSQSPAGNEMIAAFGRIREGILEVKPDLDEKQILRRLNMVSRLHGEVMTSFERTAEVFAHEIYQLTRAFGLSVKDDHFDHNFSVLEELLSAAGCRDRSVPIAEGIRRVFHVMQNGDFAAQVENVPSLVEAVQDYVGRHY